MSNYLKYMVVNPYFVTVIPVHKKKVRVPGGEAINVTGSSFGPVLYGGMRHRAVL